MKPFDLERAKAGDPVQKMDGRKVRIVYFDMKNVYPLIGVITEENGDEHEESFTNEGRYSVSDDFREEDLFMASKTVTKFVNIYRKKDGRGFYAGNLADSMEQAKELAISNPDTLICTKTISWEE